MGFDETDFVYKITVDGTDIVEYYDLEEKLTHQEVKEMWLSDAEVNHGGYIRSVFAGMVNVELLDNGSDGDETSELGSGAIPLPPADDGDK